MTTNMTSQRYLLKKFEEGILTVTLNRPEKLNALNEASLEELKSIMRVVYDDREIRGLIITGGGDKAFVAGADISEFAELNELNSRKFSEKGQEIFALIENCHKPVVALVNGYALGGGCELALACHFRIATENARLGLPEVKLGLLPAYGGTQRLTQLVGRSRALEMMLTGVPVTARKALGWGLVNDVCADIPTATARCREFLDVVLANAPLAVGMIIDCVNTFYDSGADGYQMEANSFANCCKTADFREGTAAFLEKREPVFRGE